MMRQLKTRKEKIKFLQDLQIGTTSFSDIIEPITGMRFIDGDKVFAEIIYQPGGLKHTIVFEDYSKPK